LSTIQGVVALIALLVLITLMVGATLLLGKSVNITPRADRPKRMGFTEVF
jgi:hypothetical protein